MPSRSLQTLAERLERRWRYVCEAEWEVIGQPMAAYLRFVRTHVPLRAALDRLATGATEAQAWFDDALRDRSGTGEKWHLHQMRDDSEAATFGLKVFQIAEKYEGGLQQLVNVFTRLVSENVLGPTTEGRAAFNWRRDYLVQTYLRPLHEYLLDALDSDVETLSALRWFQDWARWFGESRFQDAISRADTDKKARALEKRLQLIMFEKLFEYGLRLDIDIWRESLNDRSRPDFKVLQRTSGEDRPVTVEVKVINDHSTPSKALGALQVLTYMASPATSVGYLVIFDETKNGHVLNLSREQDGLFYFAPNEERRVYVILVPTVSQVWASEDKRVTLTDKDFDPTLSSGSKAK